MRTAAERHLSLARGHVAEAKALAALMLKGYRPIARRYAVQGGEVDLIVARGETVAFVEVKARPQMELAFEAIGASKRRRFPRGEGLARTQPLGDDAHAARRRGFRGAAALAEAPRGRVRDRDVSVSAPR
jgi:Uncharacterised protein family UPF0102